MPDNHLIIQSFIDYLKFEKRYSQHTIKAYENDLISFFDYLQITYEDVQLINITHAFVRGWLAKLKSEDITSKSIIRKISTLKSFFKFQLKNGLIESSPMVKVVTPKVERRLPNFVQDKDIRKLFDVIAYPDTSDGNVEKLILSLFYHTGVRVSELVNLRDHQIDYSKRCIKILGKGNKERIIPLSSDLIIQIQNYLKMRNKIESLDDGFFFRNGRGKKFSNRSVYSIVKKYLSLVTTIEKRGPHVMRHTFATHLTNNGADLNAIKELLGHTSLAATQIYTHNSIDKLKNIHNKAHPKA